VFVQRRYSRGLHTATLYLWTFEFEKENQAWASTVRKNWCLQWSGSLALHIFLQSLSEKHFASSNRKNKPAVQPCLRSVVLITRMNNISKRTYEAHAPGENWRRRRKYRYEKTEATSDCYIPSPNADKASDWTSLRNSASRVQPLQSRLR
jgi:hypothetical protein